MSDLNQFIEQWTPYVTKVAQSQHKGSALFDPDDMSQEVFIKLVDEYDKLKDLNELQMKTVIRGAAIRYAKKQRIDYLYFSGVVTYTPADIRKLLRSLPYRRVGSTVEIDGYLDLQEALGVLSPAQHRVVLKFYVFGEPVSEAEERQARRAVEKMSNHLNQELSEPAISLEQLIENEEYE